MLRVAVGRLSTPHGATWSPEPRTHVGQKLPVATDCFAASGPGAPERLVREDSVVR